VRPLSPIAQPRRRGRVRRRPRRWARRLDPLTSEPQLAGYSYLAAARADFLLRLGRIDEARTAYQEALLLTENTVERDYLTHRLDQLQD